MVCAATVQLGVLSRTSISTRSNGPITVPQGSRARVARVVAGAVVPITGALGRTAVRARAASDVTASRPGTTPSGCVAERLARATASVASFGVACLDGVTSTVQSAWWHVQEVEASEARALRTSADRTRAQQRADERRERARKAARRKANAERRAAERKAARQAADRRAARKAAKRRQASTSGKGWRNAPIVTWYGPGFYGNRTACGVRYTRRIVGVAHRTLPCGTLVEFKWHGITATAPVIDRGPFASSDYVFDFSAALSCDVFKPRKVENACFTRHDVKYRVVGRVPLKRYLRTQ